MFYSDVIDVAAVAVHILQFRVYIKPHTHRRGKEKQDPV